MDFVSTDQEEVRRKDQSLSDRRKDRLDYLRGMLKTKRGRRFFYDMLAELDVWNATFIENTSLLQYTQGKRDFGHKLFVDIMEADPQAVMRMHEENFVDSDEKEDYSINEGLDYA